MGPAGRSEVLRDAAGALTTGRSVLLHGPSGIGKSTIVEAIATHLSATGARVLRTSPAEVEASLPYLVLVDLFAGVLPRIRGLAPHLREALEAALLRTASSPRPRDGLTMRIAVLELLRRLAAEAPVTLIIDDAQWVDEASAEVLAFAVRRLSDTNVTVLAAERVANGEPTTGRLCPAPVHPILVTPLDYPGIAALLAEQDFGSLPTIATRRILEASGGNPLFAVELGRALSKRSGSLEEHEPLPVPDKLKGLLTEHLAGLDSATLTSLLFASAMARPSIALLARLDVLPEDGLDAAERAQVISVTSDGRITFRHPLLRELVYADSTAGRRRKAHATLASIVDEPAERIRHLALGSPAPDEATAALADAAAADAAARGAFGSAATLSRLAAQRTPPSESRAIAVRLLTAAQHADAAGHVAEARESASAALAAGGNPGVRVAARLAGDTDQVIRALGMQATMALTLGREDADELHACAYRLAEGRPVNPATVDARQSWAMTALFQGDITTARQEISQLESDVRGLGLVRELMSVLISSAAVYARSGYGADALRAARECERLFADAGSSPGIGLVVAALAEWCAGSAESSIGLATKAIAASEALGDTEWLEVACAVLGQALLLSGDGPAAVAAFTRAAELEAAARSGDPAVIPWHADHVEALVLAGQLEAATEAFTEVRRRVSRFRRPVVRLGLERACAMHRAASGDPAGAAGALHDAIEQYAERSYPIDVARAYLILGQLERRARRRAAARAAFTEAIDRFTAIGACAWLPVARGELARLDNGQRPRAEALSETETRIVHFVRSGATNREIAAAMYLSVKAVEAHLSRLYRRFGVRNRTDLLRILK